MWTTDAGSVLTVTPVTVKPVEKHVGYPASQIHASRMFNAIHDQNILTTLVALVLTAQPATVSNARLSTSATNTIHAVIYSAPTPFQEPGAILFNSSLITNLNDRFPRNNYYFHVTLKKNTKKNSEDCGWIHSCLSHRRI